MNKVRSRQSGSSMLEVLISIVIFSLGILGMIGLQVTAMKSNQSALSRSVAVEKAYEILDRMRANASKAKDGEYDLALGDAPSGDEKLQSTADKVEWIRELAASLPAGDGGICRRATPDSDACTAEGDYFVIQVQWTQSGTGSGAKDFITQDAQRVVVVGAL
ncbi:type IV pilus modification protein PilV [Azovibrio restrictus]|nr:type IV pilus modification protein PilV [Azovibrio restrictus]MDD3482400.1 type IV pilus modification protein PilV [Azovibrio restrictus]